MCSLINIKLISFSFILLLIMTGKISSAAHSARSDVKSVEQFTHTGHASLFVLRGEAARRADPVAAARADAVEVAADQEFLELVKSDPKYLQAVRIKFENYSMAITAATIAANAESYRAYDSALTDQERFYFIKLDRVRAELAAIRKQFDSERMRAEKAERELSVERELAAELRAKIITSVSTSIIGRPPLPPGRSRSRTSSSGSGSGALGSGSGALE